jgi:hypothetical protein
MDRYKESVDYTEDFLEEDDIFISSLVGGSWSIDVAGE